MSKANAPLHSIIHATNYTSSKKNMLCSNVKSRTSTALLHAHGQGVYDTVSRSVVTAPKAVLTSSSPLRPFLRSQSSQKYRKWVRKYKKGKGEKV